MKFELFDRHAEHVDEDVPLCVHELRPGGVKWGDTVRVLASMDMPGWLVTSKMVRAEVEIEFYLLSEDHIRIVINHADYMAVRDRAVR